MKNKLVVVRTSMSDDSDYNYIYDIAVNNTLEPYWQWAKDNNIDISFTKHTDNNVATWNLMLAIVAEFPTDTDMALFKLTFGTFPLKHIDLKTMENARFF